VARPTLSATPIVERKQRIRKSAPDRLPTGFDRSIERLLSLKAVMAITSWSRTSINRGIKEGWFPKPIKLSGRHRIVWREGDIRDYVEAQWGQTEDAA
jgi:predicted DNA-binding transcriptional regulator AlpA